MLYAYANSHRRTLDRKKEQVILMPRLIITGASLVFNFDNHFNFNRLTSG